MPQNPEQFSVAIIASEPDAHAFKNNLLTSYELPNETDDGLASVITVPSHDPQHMMFQFWFHSKEQLDQLPTVKALHSTHLFVLSHDLYLQGNRHAALEKINKIRSRRPDALIFLVTKEKNTSSLQTQLQFARETGCVAYVEYEDAVESAKRLLSIPLANEDANYKMDGSQYSFIDGLAWNKSTRATKGS